MNLRRGGWDSFLYRDPHDREASQQGFGTGDGSRAAWPLVRSFGGFAEPVRGIVEAPQVFVDGQPAAATVSPQGAVSFSQAPPPGSLLTWSGPYYWRCRFLKDGAEFNEFLAGWHDLRGLGFTSLKE